MVAATSNVILQERVALGRLWWASLLAGFVSTIANVVVYYIASAAGAISQTVLIETPAGAMPITVAAVIINSFAPAIVAGILLALLNRFTRRPIRNFRIISAVLLVLSFANPFFIPNVPLTMALALNLMHVVAAAIIVGMLTTVPVKR